MENPDKGNKFQTVVRSMMDSAGGVISSRTVMGDPVEVGDTILIPLSDVTIGCAAGSNNAEKKDNGMGGFSAKISPSAVLIIKDGLTKVVNIKDQNVATKLMDMVPDVIDRFMAGNPGMIDEDDAVGIAFPGHKNEKAGKKARKDRNKR